MRPLIAVCVDQSGLLSGECLLRDNLSFFTSANVLMKRYQNLWPMARRPVSRHTRAEAVDTGCQRDIPVLQSAKSGIQFLTIESIKNYLNFIVLVDFRSEIGEIPDFYHDFKLS